MTPELTILLLIAGIVCIALEVYLPGGFMAIAGAAVIIWATVEAYRHSANFGTMLLVCGIGGSISVSWFSFKYLSTTKEGKKALLMDTHIELPEDQHKDLEGKIGQTLTVMRPSGIIEIDGERYDAASRGEYIEKDVLVKVLKIEADHVYVREVQDSKNNKEESTL